jgi:membrane-associated phospholipid phosphatase
VVCVVALAVLYVVAVRTGWGQRLDNAALAGRTSRPAVQRATARLLDTITLSSLVLGAIAISLIAVARQRIHLAVTAGALLLVGNVTAQVLKDRVLARPSLVSPDPLGPSFPSGHATVAMSLAVALFLVVPARMRAATAIGGLLYACAVGTGTVTAGWHRPSDVMGGYLVAIGTGAAAAAALVVWRGTERGRSADTRQTPLLSPLLAGMGIALVGVAFIGFATTFVAIRQDDLDAVHLGGSYAAALTAIVGVALVLVAAFLTALRGVDLDPNPAVTSRGAIPRGTTRPGPSLR